MNHEIKEQLNHKSIRYHWHEADVTVLEGLLARGDRKVGAAILAAYKNGALYDAWSETFDRGKWQQAFEETGLDIDFYTTRKRSTDEILPWDFIDIGVSKKHMIKEWERAQNGEVTPNCKEKCAGCGAAVFGGGVCFEGKN